MISRRITQLPPGPRQPAALQTILAWRRPTAFLERCRERYGRRFTMRVLGQPPFVVLSDPEEIKQVFMAAPDVLHPGEGVRVLESIVGRNSVILLDEDAHMEQRRLLLPAFHGERMQRLAGVMDELVERELASWPRGQAIELHPQLQRVTLEIILRVVFGLRQGAQLDELRKTLTELLAFSESPLSLLPAAQRVLSGRGRWERFPQLHADVDRQLYELIDQRRRERGEQDDGDGGHMRGGEGQRDDVLDLLLGARHADGSPMSAHELRDELVTALVAGHETTASQLAWAFERMAREPAVVRRLTRELDAGEGEEYLNATIQEILRLRPVLAEAEPRVVKQAIEIGGVEYPPGVALVASAYLVHRDPDIYPDPLALRPERFLESEGGKRPGTYTWIPFGGGRTRCLGASFALLEMRVVLSAVLGRCEVAAVDPAPERTRRRSITLSPAGQANVILRERSGGQPKRAGAERVPALS
ncbi:MAG TPA: cytochrome P450 [Solirubrobacteraceae bacterium]|jgi:cytochrome P450|nr:cytochrome P450 [Solirubrobacteraceae bacterium]